MNGQRKLTLAVPVLLLVLLCAVKSAELFVQDFRFTRVQTEVSFWGRSDYLPTVATVHRSGRALERVLQASPRHPDYLSLQANFFAWRAYWESDAELERLYSAQAVDSQYAALESRPAHLHSRAKMLEYQNRLHDIEK